MGVDPFPPVTLRELIIGAENFRKLTWDHTAELIAAMGTIAGGALVHRDQVHPYREYVPQIVPDADPAQQSENMIRKQVNKSHDLPTWATRPPTDLVDQGIQHRSGQDQCGQGSVDRSGDHAGPTVHPEEIPSIDPTP
jgi:hypothetical protein